MTPPSWATPHRCGATAGRNDHREGASAQARSGKKRALPHRRHQEPDITEPARGPHEVDSPAEDQQVRRDKDLFDISLWWLPLIMVGVVAALWLSEQIGLFGF